VGESKASPRRITVALRRAEALRMRAAGASYSEIVAAGLGYKTSAAAVQDVQRALAATVAEPAADLRALLLLRFDEALQRLAEDERRVREVRDRVHYVVSHGKVVHLDGKPLVDDAPVLHANAQLMAIEAARRANEEGRRKLLGLDAPTKVEVITDDAIDREIRQLTDELERAAAAQVADAEGATAAES
jgi:hypothetical protein